MWHGSKATQWLRKIFLIHSQVIPGLSDRRQAGLPEGNSKGRSDTGWVEHKQTGRKQNAGKFCISKQLFGK